MNDLLSTSLADLAAPLDDLLPCGENLEYDPQFLALEAALNGKPEVQYGSTITPATGPDWKTARALALELMGRTRDLRVVVGLTRALLGQDGAPGLAAGLSLLAALLATQWEHLHPQLDADDDNDPTLRLNTLAALVESGGMLRQLRDMPLVEVRAIGAFSLRDSEAGEHDGAGGASGVAPATILAAFGAAPQDQLATTCAALDTAYASVQAIEATLAQHLGAGAGIDLTPLAAMLSRAAAQVRPHLIVTTVMADLQGQAEAVDGGGMPAQREGEIADRADVVRLLDRLCAWYARAEPSSPVPLLLQRARGLVDMNFVELLEELAPDGLNQLTQISGVRRDS
ncbi:type VI secretion system protein TssA [Massilia sp. CFBP9012]|uniref:type VI secretion system protein TssA n=1 Tax=Massilia sp. CFBP9012 TaxID=3096531 RepID=UPI002A6B74F3|nr:type VI secretion system protein TssA [Massilia sp. CFBP9012]MDY0974764.1 type VI secretion system protein TssA [Massilia sp. CFBP9012]